LKKLFLHSYITLKHQSLHKIAIFGAFLRKSPFQKRLQTNSAARPASSGSSPHGYTKRAANAAPELATSSGFTNFLAMKPEVGRWKQLYFKKEVYFPASVSPA